MYRTKCSDRLKIPPAAPRPRPAVRKQLQQGSAQFRVIVTKRPKLACRSCTGIVVQGPAPARLIEGGIPTEAMIAHVLVARYADHLPLYRQAQILARQGVISRAVHPVVLDGLRRGGSRPGGGAVA